jgi:hypothetical protein
MEESAIHGQPPQNQYYERKQYQLPMPRQDLPEIQIGRESQSSTEYRCPEQTSYDSERTHDDDLICS